MTGAPEKTAAQKVAADVTALLRARCGLLWVVTREEARAERHLVEAAAGAGYVPRFWDVAQGVTGLSGSPDSNLGDPDPGATLREIGTRRGERGVWIMRDLPTWLAGMPGAVPLRQLCNLARTLPALPRESAQAVIVITPSAEVPPELAGHAVVIEWPLPDRREIEAILDSTLEALPDDIRAGAAPNGDRAAAVDAAVGLSGEEAASCYARSLVQYRRIDPVAVAQEKRRVIARERVLQWYDPLPAGLNAVGGLENLKAWLMARRDAYSPAARAYGLPAPKGALLVGVPGCGKSLVAKAIATAWGVPLLNFDLGALRSKFVGESEGNLRKALRVIETVGRCVVWLDEIEKKLPTQGGADGGVSADALGSVLTWMQERQGEAFVLATANDVSALPPELLRKGRFDEIWFVDLPNESERESILRASLRTMGRDADAIDIAAVARGCSDFTGSELAAIVPDAMYAAFADGVRAITTEDLLVAACAVVPLAKTMAEKIASLRQWAQGRARPASALEVSTPRSTSPLLDL